MLLRPPLLHIVILSFVVSGCSGSTKSAPGPLLNVDSPRRHLSPLVMSEVREVGIGEIADVFELRNLTAGVLKVTLLSRNCTCVGVQANGRNLDSHEELVIPASQIRPITITRPIPAGGGILSADVTLQVKEEAKSRKETILLSVDREIVPDVNSVPLVIREVFTESSSPEVTRWLDLSAASRDQDWLQKASLTFEDFPDGISVGEVTEISNPRKVDDGIFRRDWRIKLSLTRDFSESSPKNISAILRIMVRASEHPDRVVSHDVPVSILFKNSSKSLAGS
ncbi:MAG: hypothetical protein U0941_07220 [Planctomycetaceae bacterium]